MVKKFLFTLCTDVTENQCNAIIKLAKYMYPRRKCVIENSPVNGSMVYTVHYNLSYNEHELLQYLVDCALDCMK